VKVALACPTYTKPYPQLLASVEAAIPAMDAAGIEHSMVWEVGCPYVSHARATMLRKALDWGAETIVFLDHDLSFEPEGLLKLIEAEGPVVSGLYRFKKDEEEYMGILREAADGRPVVRSDGCIRADKVPAGFLKITREAVDQFMKAYPELIYGVRYNPSVDLFNHGAHEGVWYGEDYSFSRRWRECGGEIWIVPDINLTHHSADKDYPGNFHRVHACANRAKSKAIPTVEDVAAE
jgi:glycosyltransferase involved in cell wall biosynthesis